MLKKSLAILLLLLALLCFTACGNEETDPYPGLDKLVELTAELAKSYNDVAEKAIANGWEYDDDTVEQLDKIATVIDNINSGIVDPETFEEGQIEVFTKSAKEFKKELETIAKKVASEYEIEGMTSTDGQ